MSTKAKLLSGQTISFTPGEAEQERTLEAAWIKEAVRKGVAIHVENAIVKGTIDFKYATFEKEFCLLDCDITHPADFGHAIFRQNVDLSRSRFHQGADLKSAKLDYDFILNRSAFLAGQARFMDLLVLGVFSANDARFGNGVDANFNRARFEKSVFFFRTLFEGKIVFASVRVGAQAGFMGAVFRHKASFNRAHIFGSAVFRSDPEKGAPIAAVFEDEAEFINAEIRGDADFTGVEFRGSAVHLNGITVHGNAFFQRALFLGELWFANALLSGDTVFSGACLKQTAEFSRTKIGGDALFGQLHQVPAATFEGSVAFVGTEIAGDAVFQGVLFKNKANFNHARIVKGALFRSDSLRGVPSTVFEAEADFTGVEIGGQAEFSGAVFKRAVCFDVAKINGKALFNQACFEGEAVFRGAYIRGQAGFQRTLFKGRANFNSIRIEGPLFFCTRSGAPPLETYDTQQEPDRTHFEGAADFINAEIASDADFNGAEFSGAEPVRFDGAKIGGNARFRKTTFVGDVLFTGAHIHGSASFQGAIFEKNASFNHVKIYGPTFFREERLNPQDPPELTAAIFRGEADFVDIEFGADADFQGAEFFGNAIFNGGTFAGSAKFDNARFHDMASFVGTHFLRQAIFEEIVFHGRARFSSACFDSDASFAKTTFANTARFEACCFEGLALFTGGDSASGTVFDDASFAHARFSGDARFEHAVFKAHARFREASFRVLYFSETENVGQEQQFQATLDLRGCTYERIQVHRPSLLQRIRPYDRQPYTELERALLAVGQDLAADEVYLERRKVERKQKWERHQLGGWLFDWLYALLANYGVRPYRLAAVGLALLLAGTVFFSRPGAVSSQQGKLGSTPGAQVTLSYYEAFAASVHYFLPMDVPLGSQWIPAPVPVEIGARSVKLRISPETFATLLRLAGWILVPLAVAALTGLLRRVAP